VRPSRRLSNRSASDSSADRLRVQACNEVDPVQGKRLVDGIDSGQMGIVKLFGNGCGAVDVSGLGGER
jgi:hypothetical protein